MTLIFCTDLAAADWIARSGLPWHRLVTLGPAGFGAYARLRFLPDPAHPGQSENDADAEDWRAAQLPHLYTLLAAHTTTPDDCYFAVWEGFDQSGHTTTDRAAHHAADRDAHHDIDHDTHQAAYRDAHHDAGRAAHEDANARPGLAPQRPAGSTGGPRLVLPHRAYWLFRGPLSDVGGWDAIPGRSWRLDGAPAAFVWPADRAWCVAHDVDPHYAGIGGSGELIARLAAEPGLDLDFAHALG